MNAIAGSLSAQARVDRDEDAVVVVEGIVLVLAGMVALVLVGGVLGAGDGAVVVATPILVVDVVTTAHRPQVTGQTDANKEWLQNFSAVAHVVGRKPAVP